MTITEDVANAKFKPTKPLSKDQRMWLEDLFTSLTTWFAYQERATNRIKQKLHTIEMAIREGKECE